MKRKLYQLPRNTHFKWNGNKYLLKTIDGMYSICVDSRGMIIHLAANLEVEEVV